MKEKFALDQFCKEHKCDISGAIELAQRQDYDEVNINVLREVGCFMRCPYSAQDVYDWCCKEGYGFDCCDVESKDILPKKDESMYDYGKRLEKAGIKVKI